MSTINGFGTTFYGECDYRTDGTYITTYWIVVAFIPIIPLYSARILYKTAAPLDNKPQYQYEKLPIHWQQVARIWSFTGVSVLGYVAWAWYMEYINANDPIRASSLVAFAVTMLLLPYFLRYRAKKKIGFVANVTKLPVFTKKTLCIIITLILFIFLLYGYFTLTI
ncbi:hypothetical protein [Alysiella crassa]|uniref:Uncharacterized protein n=1 Tax=Alysiella crassa TaxID=153491 RepID=A0A376BUU2_9NEIS|nr:hypothetical protein [Alysiella crassa]UOP06211.1 hypothetical protein LVJ80_10325 [Alysiella crassa]SSY80689.1 Uncharacterised protein [Alysiella crassa]